MINEKRIGQVIFKISLLIILSACGLGTDEGMNVNTNTLLPPDMVQNSSIDEEIMESEKTCKIQLNGDSIHDMIQIFEFPRFDLDNPIGGLAMKIGCVDDCPLLSVAVQGMMTTPQLQCEADRQTCGVWHQVDWKQYTDSTPISGWVSDQDDDIDFIGNCTNLAVINPETIFTQPTESQAHP